MGGLTVNFAEVEGGFEPIPPDVYDCIIDRVEVRESNSSDNDYLNFELTVTDGDYEDRKVWLGSSLSPKALGFLKDTLLALEVIEEDEELDIEWADDVDITPKEGPLLTNPDLMGMACQVRTVNKMYEGSERQDAWRSEIVGVGDAAPAKKRSNGSGSKTAAKASASKAKSGSTKKTPARKRTLR